MERKVQAQIIGLRAKKSLPMPAARESLAPRAATASPCVGTCRWQAIYGALDTEPMFSGELCPENAVYE